VSSATRSNGSMLSRFTFALNTLCFIWTNRHPSWHYVCMH
jgi:hypothetical protein